ncbi:MAG: DNA translocase FtsK 4TM domain-containing protein [Bacteroidaceae bacterium]|nr:DNA translocase FtsK 4TM domain-containing protein [Bacteroidaceae bacterium]
MAKKKTEKAPEPKEIKKNRISSLFKSETSHFVIGLISVIFAVYLLLAFTSFFFTGAADQSILDNQQPGELMQTANQVKNYAGARGAQISEYLINECFGIAAYFIVLFLAVMGMRLMRAYQFRMWKWFMSCTILMIWFSIGLGYVFDGTFTESFVYPGGLHGYNVSRWIASQIGPTGLGLLMLVTAILFCVYLTKETMRIVRKTLHPEFKLKKKEKPMVEETEKEEPIAQEEERPEPVMPQEYTDSKPTEVNFDLPKTDEPEEEDKTEDEFPFRNMQVPEDKTEEPATNQPIEPEVVEPTEETPFTITDEHTEDDEAYTGPALEPYNPRLDLENYKFPHLNLLDHYDEDNNNIDMDEQNANKDRIIEVLRSFDIEISSIKASVGPTVTLYEITPAQGIRIAKIRNLEDDIALSIAALGIRIIAPIPGKGTIGIEVPNAKPRIVPMQSILNSKKFQETTMELPIALGKTITNEVYMVDLAKAPHMLIAGATGQGKSVGLNAIVTSLLYKKHPAELKFVIVDPKKVEFSVYAPIEKHFLAKLPDGDDAIITDVTKVVQTLNSLCIEMDTRYDLLKKAGCRNVKEYNAKFIERKLNPEKGHHFMPYIVIIIDEFGDLIMTAGKEVELPICRIAQLARAVGIHAIIATQRPTTNIITGTIKANFPARVAFRVAAMMDSRTILDRSGAQQLIGKGDMLYLQGNDPVRVQCAFVDTPEVERIANYISKQQGYPTAFELPEVESEESESSAAEVDMTKLDPMLRQAAELVVVHQQGSTSLIQRKFSIGYNRAGRIMDQLERIGIVGPSQGSKARDVLCADLTDLDMRWDNIQV